MSRIIKLVLIWIIALLWAYLSQRWSSLIVQWINDQTPRPTQWINFREEVKSIEQNKYFPIDKGINLIVLAISILLFFGILLNLKIKNIPNNILLLFYILILFFIAWDIITPVIDFERGILPSTWDTIFIPIFSSLVSNTILFTVLYRLVIRRIRNLWPQTNMIILVLYTIFFGVALRYSSSHLVSIITWWWIWWPMYLSYPKRILSILISILWIYDVINIAHSKLIQENK